MSDHAVDNTTAEERALNRSVIIQVPTTVEIGDIEITEAEEPGVMIPRREPDTKGCSQPEKDMLSVAWPAAKMMINKALEMAQPDKGSVNAYLLERYFGADWRKHVPDIRAGYQKIIASWFDWNPRFECLAQTAESCPNDDPHYVTLAYVTKERHVFSKSTPYGDVRVCREGFLRSMGDLQRLERDRAPRAEPPPRQHQRPRLLLEPPGVRPVDGEGDRQRRLVRPVRAHGVQHVDLNARQLSSAMIRAIAGSTCSAAISVARTGSSPGGT